MKLSAFLALWNEFLASETAFSWYGRVEASEKRRDETRVALSRSHRMIAAEGGAGGLCMALL